MNGAGIFEKSAVISWDSTADEDQAIHLPIEEGEHKAQLALRILLTVAQNEGIAENIRVAPGVSHWFRIDIAEVQTAEGKLRLFVAIDGTSRFAYAELHQDAGKMVAARFLRNLVAAVPYAIHTVLPDNSMQFTNHARHTYASTKSSIASATRTDRFATQIVPGTGRA